MSENDSSRDVPVRELIVVPAVITLGVTLIRLVGELAGWSPTFFSREAGGAGAIVGIAWLVPVFRIYFALKLARADHGPASKGRALGYALLALLIVPVLVVLGRALHLQTGAQVSLFALAAFVQVPLVIRGWPAMGWTLLAYGLAARIPVALVMLFAMLGNWGTHYDAPPPGFPAMGVFAKWVLIGLIPQFTFWIAFTVVIGAIFGGIAVALAPGRRPVTA